MSKIPPMQAAAFGIKTNPTKPAAAKPAPNAASVKPVAPATSTKSAAANAAPKKTVMSTTSVKPAVTKTVAKPSPKPALKAASKPKADHTKKDKKNDHKHDSKKDDKKAKPEKAKVEKVKMERDSFTMPKDEYAQLTLLKARLTSMGQPAKKSELLRAGIKLLAAMSDNTLKTTLAKIPVIKTGRPNK